MPSFKLRKFGLDFLLKIPNEDFSGGPVVKNLPCNAEDVGSIPVWGSKILHAPGQGSPRTMRSNKRAHVLQARPYTAKKKKIPNEF